LALGGDGEIYILSKSDGMIRQLTAALHPPDLRSIVHSDTKIVLNWRSVPGWNYRVQYKTNLTASQWNDLAGDVTATAIEATKSNSPTDGARFYRVRWMP